MEQPAEVEDHGVPHLDDPFAGLVVGVGAVGAGTHDGEVDLFVPELPQQPGEVRRDLGLAPAGEAQLDDLEERGVGRCAGRRKPDELVVVLDGPQHREALRHRLVPRARQRLLQTEEVHRPGRVRDGVAPRRVEELASHRVRVRPVRPVADGQRGRPGAASASGRSSRGASRAGSWSGRRTRTVRRSVMAVGW